MKTKIVLVFTDRIRLFSPLANSALTHGLKNWGPKKLADLFSFIHDTYFPSYSEAAPKQNN
jgi:hypothetical protein